MNLETLIEKKKNYASKKVGDEFIVIPVKDNVAEMETLINLNEVGSFIWERLEEGVTLERIQQDIAGEFDVDAETAKADLYEFLVSLDNTLRS